MHPTHPRRRHSDTNRIGKRRLRLAIACALAASGAHAGSADFEGARRDPRYGQLAVLDAAERRAYARDYGLEAFLPPETAATRVVANCSDAGMGSLRDAVAASADLDVVDLTQLTCSTISLTTGQIVIGVDRLFIKGPGASRLRIEMSPGGGGKYDRRVFNHTGADTLQIEGVTIAGGVAAGSISAPDAAGGCIQSSGKVFLGSAFGDKYGVAVRDCRVVAPDGSGRGGGIKANEVVLRDSEVSGCQVSAATTAVGGGIDTPQLQMTKSRLYDNRITAGSDRRGGGAFALSFQVSDSTIAGNHGGFGGGIFARRDSSLVNSTISGNVADNGGGGLWIGGSSSTIVGVSNSTISDNEAIGSDGAGGVDFEQGVAFRLMSSIVAGNRAAQYAKTDLDSSVSVSGSNNLIGAPPTPALLPGDTLRADPLLLPLAFNGGRTRTHALRPESLAIDRGNDAAGLDYDQRGPGYPRVYGLAADIGAFERGDRIFRDGFGLPPDD